jgi:hypothetical protein
MAMDVEKAISAFRDAVLAGSERARTMPNNGLFQDGVMLVNWQTMMDVFIDKVTKEVDSHE